MLKLESSRCVVVLSVRKYTRKGVSTRPKWGLPPGSALGRNDRMSCCGRSCVLTRIIAVRGRPMAIPCGSGPELASRPFLGPGVED